MTDEARAERSKRIRESWRAAAEKLNGPPREEAIRSLATDDLPDVSGAWVSWRTRPGYDHPTEAFSTFEGGYFMGREHEAAAQRPPVEYPHESGDVIALGPETFVARDGSVLNWKGENYVPQRPQVSPDAAQLQARLDEAEEKLASLEAGCANLTRDELIQRITAVGPARWKAGYWLGEQRAKWEAARPPVSPEQREALVQVLHDNSGDADMPAPIRYRMTRVQADAILARFSLPSPPEMGGWVCATCGEGAPSHARSDSTCLWEPVWRSASSPPVYDVEKVADRLYSLPALDGFDSTERFVRERMDASPEEK